MSIELIMIIDEREKQNRENLQIIKTARPQDMRLLSAQTRDLSRDDWIEEFTKRK